MKRELYSTSLFKAKGSGTIYNNENKELFKFENELTYEAKKQIIHLITGHPARRLNGINQIGLLCYRLDKDHPQVSDSTTTQSLSGDMDNFTGEDPSANANKQFIHGVVNATQSEGKLRKFGRLINGDTTAGIYTDYGMAIGRTEIASNTETIGEAYQNTTNKTGKFASAITIGFSNVGLGQDQVTAHGGGDPKWLIWTDFNGSGSDTSGNASVRGDFMIPGSGSTDGYEHTSGLVEADLDTAKVVCISSANWNITHAISGETAQTLGHLPSGERCILVGAYLMDHTYISDQGAMMQPNPENGGDLPITGVSDVGTAVDHDQMGTVRVMNLDIKQKTASVSQLAVDERHETFHDVFWKEQSVFAGKYLIEGESGASLTQITDQDTIKGTYSIDFTPTSGKFGRPSIGSAWPQLNGARIGTKVLPTFMNGGVGGNYSSESYPLAIGSCDWSTAIASTYWNLNADGNDAWLNNSDWGDGTEANPDPHDRVHKEFGNYEWLEVDKTNTDGLTSVPNLMPGRLSHVAVTNTNGDIVAIKKVSPEATDDGVTWTTGVDDPMFNNGAGQGSGEYANECVVDFGQISSGNIANKVYFYCGLETEADGGCTLPALTQNVAHDATTPAIGAMYPIHVTEMISGSYDGSATTASLDPWNDGDALIINFKIKWG